jgi:hypothetical protein
MFEPKKTSISVGHPFIHLVGALSGKRGFDTMRVEMTFLWMSEFKCERVDGSFLWNFITDWTDLQININMFGQEFGIGIGKKFVVVSGIQPYWSAKFLVALFTFRLTEQGTLLVLTRWSKVSLHRHIPVPAIFLLLM